MIYFARRTNGDIKIGTTIQLSVRFKQLQSDHATPLAPLELLGVCNGGTVEERVLHEKFAAHRHEGEWFGSHESLMDFISTETIPWDGEDESGLTSLVSLKGSPELAAWLDEVVDITESGTRTHLAKRALQWFAKKHGYLVPMPKR